MSDAEWMALERKYGKEYMWNLNKQFLDSQIDKGKTFVFASNPADATGFMLREFEYLTKKQGYTFAEKSKGSGIYYGTKH